MNRYRYLFKNIGLLTLSSFATKMLSFFLVPLYTNILSTAEYGTYDIFNTTIGVLIPIFTLNIQDSVIRFAMDGEYDRKSVITIGMKYFTIGMTIVSAGLAINCYFEWSSIAKEYAVFFWLMYLSQSLSGIILGYTRGIEHIADLSVSSVINSIVVITCNIVFLTVFKWGLLGYFLANIVGPLIQCIYLLLKTKSISDICLSDKYKKVEKEMLEFCRPMMANSIAWWVNNTSDRYIIIFFCGLAQNGVYSVASKIPSILNIFQSIFSQAWTLSAVKEFETEDKDGFFTNTYRTYNCFMVIMCSVIIGVDKFLARLLYAKDFYVAWRYVPWLSIAIVFGALSGYIGGFFSAVKNSKIYAQSTVMGAIVNVILNLILTPVMGALGAAIATMVCYLVTWGIRYIISQKIVKMKIKLVRDILSYIVLVFQAVALEIINSGEELYVVEVLLFSFVIILYYKDIRMALKKIVDVLKSRWI